jgi:hypothetical protein
LIGLGTLCGVPANELVWFESAVLILHTTAHFDIGQQLKPTRALLSSVFVLMPGLVRRFWRGVGAARCPCSA